MTDLDWAVGMNKEQTKIESEGIKIVTEDLSSELLSNAKITFDNIQKEYLRHIQSGRLLIAQVFLQKMTDVAQSEEDNKIIQEIKEYRSNKFDKSYKEYIRYMNIWKKEEARPFIQQIIDTMIFVKNKEEQKKLVEEIRDLWFKN